MGRTEPVRRGLAEFTLQFRQHLLYLRKQRPVRHLRLPATPLQLPQHRYRCRSFISLGTMRQQFFQQAAESPYFQPL